MTLVREVENSETEWHERVNRQVRNINIESKGLGPRGSSLMGPKPLQKPSIRLKQPQLKFFVGSQED